MLRIGSLLIYLLIFRPPLGAEIARYRYPGGNVRVTYDASRISRHMLDEAMSFSPTISKYDFLLVPIDYRMCIAEDPLYSDCTHNSPPRLNNVDENLRRVGALRADIIKKQVPVDLLPLKEYFSEIQSFALWRMQRDREYLATGQLGALKQDYGNLKSDHYCAKVYADMSTGLIPKGATAAWDNCMWTLERDRLGVYPDKAWRSFLRSYNLLERVNEESPD